MLTTENDRTVIGFDLRVPAGGSVTIRLRLDLPPRPGGVYGILLAPLPRVRPTSWDVDIDDGTGRVARRTGPLLTPEGVVADVDG